MAPTSRGRSPIGSTASCCWRIRRSFRDRFGAGMRYSFTSDRETARPAGLAAYLRFWITTVVDTIRSGLGERSESRPHWRRERAKMTSWFVVDWRDGWRSLRASGEHEIG